MRGASTFARIALIAISCSAAASAQTGVNPDEDDVPAPPKIYSPFVERTATNRHFAEGLFWGDTHLHTSYSTDAGMIGCRLDPEDAYRFARGEEVTSSTGLRVKLSRPLDFLVVADHSDNMGFFPRLYAGDRQMLADPTGALSRAFGVYIEEAGLAYRGTFLVNPEGKIKIAEMHDNGIGRNAEELVRYRSANRYAGKYCKRLAPQLAAAPGPDSLREELCYFYRLAQPGKIEHIESDKQRV